MNQLLAITGRRPVAAILGLALAAAVAPGAGAKQDGDPRIFGWIEAVTLFPGGLELSAKLDTGARTSSLHVARHETFRRDGRQWIRFRVSHQNGVSMDFERPVVRIARIRRSQGKTVARPIVMLGICLGTRYLDVEVNLTDRENLEYPMLVGRSGMQGIAIDSSRKFTSKPRCQVRTGVR